MQVMSADAASRASGSRMSATGVAVARGTGWNVLFSDDNENGAPLSVAPAVAAARFRAIRVQSVSQSGMTIACQSADVCAAAVPAGPAASAAVSVSVAHGLGRLARRSRAAAVSDGRSRASLPFAVRDGAGPGQGVISRRACPGRRQASRDARAV